MAKRKPNAPEEIRIHLDDKPNLAKLKEKNPGMFVQVVRTAVAIAEEAAGSGKDSIPWYDLPGKFDDKLSFAEVAPAIMRAFFDAKGISPKNFDILGEEVHPLSLLKRRDIGTKGKYTMWRKHFGRGEHEHVDSVTITGIIRRMLYYARYIDVEKYGAAFMSNQLEAHKALPMENAEKLVFYPALRYQKEKFGDLHVGQFWDDIGAFYGGEITKTNGPHCPACHIGELTKIGDYYVCPTCNLGVKLV